MDEEATKLSEAIKNGSSETVLEIITQVPEEKRKELINHLVFYEKFEKKITMYPNVSGYYISALGIAIIYKKKEIVEMLLEHGADINQLTTYTYKDVPGYPPNHFRKDFSGDNALIIAYKMGDPEIINLLKTADMKNLSNAYLFMIDLSGVNLSDSILSGAILSSSNLIGADLTNAELVGTNLVNAKMTATLINAKLMDAKLLNAKLMDAKLMDADLTGADLKGAILTDANLSDAIIVLTDLSGAELINTKLINAKLMHAKLMHATLINAKLMDAKLMDAELMDANLTGAKLMGADLTNAKLMDADLTGADLTGAILTGADFTGAILTDAILPDDFFIHDPNDFIERSPRTRYANRMETSSIAMLGGKRGDLLKIRIGEDAFSADASSADASSADTGPPQPPSRNLFQIFSRYSNLSKLHVKKIDCVFQTLFSLGLREIHTAKHESNVINKLGDYKKKLIGVQALQLESYVQQIFGLKKENTKVINVTFSIIQMNNYLSTKLLENTCTILLFTYKNGEFGHCVTAFKHNNQIYIFDPQLTTTYSSSIYSFKDEMGIIYENINSFTVICLNEVVESKPLIVDNCSLPILIAGRRKKSRKNKKTKKNQET